jgi:hypothetical protein
MRCVTSNGGLSFDAVGSDIGLFRQGIARLLEGFR